MTGLLMTGLFDFLSYALGIGDTLETFHACLIISFDK